MDFYIKQGDTLPIFAVQLLDDNGNPIDLSEHSSVMGRRHGS